MLLYCVGEVMAVYAEPNEIAGPDATVYKAMTDLRARVSMPPYPAGYPSAMRERIRHDVVLSGPLKVFAITICKDGICRSGT